MIDKWINHTRKERNALANYFNVVGSVALAMVMSGKISHAKAMELLLMLRRLKLDNKGDLASRRTVEQWFFKHKINKGVTFAELSDA
jgi:hypothetical protein